MSEPAPHSRRSSLRVASYRERPDLAAHVAAWKGLWPEFLLHGQAVRRRFPKALEAFPDFFLFLLDGSGRVGGSGFAAPLAWPGTPGTLPAGWDAALLQSLDDRAAARQPTAACALSAIVAPRRRGRGIGRQVLSALKAVVASRGLHALLAPVRPTWKCRYPLTPFERYVEWKRPDGSAFDPWIHLHWEMGARVARIAPRSMVVRATLADWTKWTGLHFPESGPYVVPGALCPITVDTERAEALYEEPNLWMIHSLD
jgi:GNAT superfamily N-acetyltransferase